MSNTLFIIDCFLEKPEYADLFTRLLHLNDASLKATKNWMLYLKRCDPHIGKPGR